MGRTPFIVLVICLAIAPAASAQYASVVAPGSAAALLNESIVFYAGFDRGRVAADLAIGRADPLSVEGSANFVPGRFGGALLLGVAGGGAKVEYAAEHHLDFGKSGALSFWIRPVKWPDLSEPRRGYARFVYVPAGKGSFVVQRMGFDRAIRRQDSLIVGLFDLPRLKRLYLEHAGTAGWESDTWRLVVVNWEQHAIALSVDGAAFETRAAPAGLAVEAFHAAPKPHRFIVGDLLAETSALDEFTIYSHPLEAADVAILYGR